MLARTASSPTVFTDRTRVLVGLWVAAAVVVLFAWPAHAQTRHGAWVVTCPSVAAGCTMAQKIVDRRGRRIVAIEIINRGVQAFAQIFVPLGIYIPAGVAVRVDDGAPIPTNVVDCDRQGCRSVVALDATAITAMRKGGRLAVVFVDSKSGKRLTVTGSLKGFTAASNGVGL